jgi:hypothetical protein
MILSVIILPRLNVNLKMFYQDIKKFYKQKYEMQPDKCMKCKPFRQDLPGFSMHAHTQCKVIVLYTLEGNNSCKLKLLIYLIYICKILLYWYKDSL